MKRSVPEKIAYGINVVFLLLFALITFYPFYYVLIYSLSSPTEAVGGVYLIPRSFTTETFARIINTDIGHAAIISTLRTVIGTAFSLFITSMLAFAVSKPQMPARRFFYTAIVIVMYFSAGLIPWYLTMKAYGLRNTFFAYILPGAAAPFNMILIKTYFESLPRDMEESAHIDGAGYFTVLMRIVLPVSLPILATVSIFTAVGQWNSWMDNFFLVTDKNLTTLQYFLYQIMKESITNINVTNLKDLEELAKRIPPKSIRMATVVITTMPVLFVYPLFQRFFTSGLMIGAIKG